MNKLIYVRKALQDNPNITIVGAPEKKYIMVRRDCWSHTVDFHVAPRTGGMYTAGELQALLESLVPGLEPNSKDDFREWDDTMNFGKLYFDESIGTETIHREIAISDESMSSSDGLINGMRIIEQTEVLRRRIWVRPFPNVDIAAAALQGDNEHGISKFELSKYRGIVHRFAAALS